MFQSTHPRRVWHTLRRWLQAGKMFQSTHPRRVWRQERQGWCYSGMFQSTHPRRVWPVSPALALWWYCFNPHTHEGCDSLYFTFLLLRYLFQSTHPRRVWLMVCGILASILVFQSTHPRRVWHLTLTIFTKSRSFNPHTHEGCDIEDFYQLTWQGVSIHTPTKGVTVSRWYSRSWWSVSIHTPTKGVTRGGCFSS